MDNNVQHDIERTYHGLRILVLLLVIVVHGGLDNLGLVHWGHNGVVGVLLPAAQGTIFALLGIMIRLVNANPQAELLES